MFNNAVNREDALAALELLRRSDVRRRILRRIGRADRRTRATWDGTELKVVLPYEVPALRERVAGLVPGSSSGTHEGLAEWALGDRHGLHGLALGCGYGSKERRWAQTGRFVSLDAYDLSPDRIRHAQQAAREHGLDGVLNFVVADSRNFRPPRERYEVVLVDSALHHMSRLDQLIPQIREWLTDDGIFFMNEFVGPRRWQWTDQQVEIANTMLDSLPDRYRIRFDGRFKRRVGRPSRLRMRIEDPSEAVESDRILPLLQEHLRPVDRIELPGAAVGLVLVGIGHHFVGDDIEARTHLERLLDEESALLASGALVSDHVVATYAR